jgi:arsenate reductase-like glutaredoxin family protein
MLMTLLALYLFSSSGTLPMVAALDQAKAAIKRDIAEGPRRDGLVAVIEKAESETKEAVEKRKKTTQELVGLARTYDSQAGDIQPMFKQLRAEIGSHQEALVGYRFELKAKMSREEWAKAFPPQR